MDLYSLNKEFYGGTQSALSAPQPSYSNRTYNDYPNVSTPILTNVICGVLAGFTWYQFVFYCLQQLPGPATRTISTGILMVVL